MIDITKVIFASTTDTLKNYDSETGSIAVTSTSYSAGQYKTFSTSIPLDYVDSINQKLFNFTTDSDKYYVGDIQVSLNANFDAQVRSNIVGRTLFVDCFVINQTGGTVSNPAFTLNIEVRRFTGPFN